MVLKVTKKTKVSKSKKSPIKKELAFNHFRVAIFGSARIKKGDPRYKTVNSLATKLGERGFDVVTGGGPGLMQAANSGHHSGKKKNKKNHSHSIGLNIKLPFEQHPGKHLDVYKNFDRFSNRLDTFMTLSNVVVVAPGGIGTVLEFFYTWQLIQVKHTCNMPIILLGSMYKGLIDWIKKGPLKHKLMSKDDMKNIYLATKQSEVLKIIDQLNNDHQAGQHICHNFSKYKLK
mgnify:CR=1 FL=1